MRCKMLTVCTCVLTLLLITNESDAQRRNQHGGRRPDDRREDAELG